MKYSILIRKLIQASEEARWQDADVADRLRERCVNGIDIIRQTLMNSVCDPRFRMHVAAIPNWRDLARRQLEEFASKLESIRGLTEEIALTEMDKMLYDWIETATSVAKPTERKLSYDRYDTSDKHNIQKALDDYVDGLPLDEEDDPALPLLGWSGEDTVNPMMYDEPEEDEDEEPEQGSNTEDDEGRDDEDEMDDEENGTERYNPLSAFGRGVMGYGIGKGRGNEREIEDRFFANVPPSLIELARRIGRSANLEGEPSGSFMSASKSDIAGITTGNDLNCILPSELALMASPATEDIFYKNYVTLGLQLFASVSHTSRSTNHHEGPIIICLDTSSSMLGEPITVAKALTIAVCIIAQRKKRKVIVVKYSDTHDPFFLRNISAERKQLLEFLKSGECGGNNEDELFRWLFTDLLPAQGDYQYGDILCVSDFGWTGISPETMELIRKEKEKNMKFYGLNIGRDDFCDRLFPMSSVMAGYNDNVGWGTPDKVCDSLWEYTNGVCREVTSL